ncbi:MAG: winged helix-turn-helix domain-containing protein [Dehalococcoidia bacterium]|nr:winged helix-turn-helix domain-containing protein [Dehalococcoidia bacterium]
MGKWSFLSNHALVLLQLVGHPGSTLREIALELGLTERSVIVILKTLEEDGIVSRRRDGRRNRYTINRRTLAEHLERQTQSPYTLEQIAMQTAALAREYRQTEG